jgi:hypothetical protein
MTMPEVIHDPATDWCACEPNSDDRCGYRLLADEVIELFNPRDDDAAEVGICIDALGAAAEYIAAQPCTCPSDPDWWGACQRCQVLGRKADKPIER